jgi:hypothetical protein
MTMTKRDNSGNDRKTVLCVNIFQEDINMAKKNPIAAAAKKMAAAPVSNSVVTEVKAAEVKAETKTEAPKAEEKKAEEPKKETKKAPAKRAAAKDIKTSVVVQFAGKEVTEKELIAAVKKAYTKKGNKVGDIKTIEIYVKPEENAAYYVVNGVGADDYKIEL